MKIDKTSLRHLRIGAVSLMLLSTVARSAVVLAVLDVVPSNEVEELTISEYRLLSDELRRQAVNILPAKEFTVLTRDGIISLMPPDEEEAECLAESCTVDIGRAIGAEYISSGQIAKFAGKLSLTVELYETMGGRLIGSFLTYGTGIEGLMETIKTEGPLMFEKMETHYFANAKKPEDGKPEAAESIDSAKIEKPEAEKPKMAESIETGIKNEGSSYRLPKWVAISLDVLGAGAIGFGIYQDRQMVSRKKKYDGIREGSPQDYFDSAFGKVEHSQDMRNASYIIGVILLAGGVSVHIFF